MNRIYIFLEAKKSQLKRASLWIQSLLLFLLFFALIYASHLGSNYARFSIETLQRNIGIVLGLFSTVLVFSGTSFLLSLLVLFSDGKKELPFDKITHIFSTVTTFVITWLLLGYVNAEDFASLSANHIFLFLSALLVTISIYTLFHHIVHGRTYLITKETAQKYYNNVLEWWKSLPKRVISKCKSTYTLCKEYYNEFNRIILPKEIINAKKSNEVSPETESRIQKTFKKPLYLRKSFIIFITLCFCFQMYQSFFILKDWSKKTINVFENMVVVFHGISGDGHARIEIMPYSDNPKLNEFYQTFGFRIEGNMNLQNGDSVKIVLVRYDQQMMTESSYKIETFSKEFTISRLDTIPDDFSGVLGIEPLAQTMIEYMDNRQNFMTRYNYVPMIECYSPMAEKSTHYSYFIDSKYGVVLRVYDVKESFSKNDIAQSFEYAFLLIYDHIVVNNDNVLSDYQMFKGVKIGEIEYKEYMKELESRNNFSCTYLGD
jgi:hypothetical protein